MAVKKFAVIAGTLLAGVFVGSPAQAGGDHARYGDAPVRCVVNGHAVIDVLVCKRVHRKAVYRLQGWRFAQGRHRAAYVQSSRYRNKKVRGPYRHHRHHRGAAPKLHPHGHYHHYGYAGEYGPVYKYHVHSHYHMFDRHHGGWPQHGYHLGGFRQHQHGITIHHGVKVPGQTITW